MVRALHRNSEGNGMVSSYPTRHPLAKANWLVLLVLAAIASALVLPACTTWRSITYMGDNGVDFVALVVTSDGWGIEDEGDGTYVVTRDGEVVAEGWFLDGERGRVFTLTNLDTCAENAMLASPDEVERYGCPCLEYRADGQYPLLDEKFGYDVVDVVNVYDGAYAAVAYPAGFGQHVDALSGGLALSEPDEHVV